MFPAISNTAIVKNPSAPSPPRRRGGRRESVVFNALGKSPFLPTLSNSRELSKNNSPPPGPYMKINNNQQPPILHNLKPDRRQSPLAQVKNSNLYYGTFQNRRFSTLAPMTHQTAPKLNQCKANQFNVKRCSTLTTNVNGFCDVPAHQEMFLEEQKKFKGISFDKDENDYPNVDHEDDKILFFNEKYLLIDDDAQTMRYSDFHQKKYSEYCSEDDILEEDDEGDVDLVIRGVVNIREKVMERVKVNVGGLILICVKPKNAKRWIPIYLKSAKDFYHTFDSYISNLGFMMPLKTNEQKTTRKAMRNLCAAEFSIKARICLIRNAETLASKEADLNKKYNFPVNDNKDESAGRNIKLKRNSPKLFNIFLDEK